MKAIWMQNFGMGIQTKKRWGREISMINGKIDTGEPTLLEILLLR